MTLPSYGNNLELHIRALGYQDASCLKDLNQKGGSALQLLIKAE